MKDIFVELEETVISLRKNQKDLKAINNGKA